jgi:hypothetical protein
MNLVRMKSNEFAKGSCKRITRIAGITGDYGTTVTAEDHVRIMVRIPGLRGI